MKVRGRGEEGRKKGSRLRKDERNKVRSDDRYKRFLFPSARCCWQQEVLEAFNTLRGNARSNRNGDGLPDAEFPEANRAEQFAERADSPDCQVFTLHFSQRLICLQLNQPAWAATFRVKFQGEQSRDVDRKSKRPPTHTQQLGHHRCVTDRIGSKKVPAVVGASPGAKHCLI